MSARKTKRSVCPVACTLDVIGDKWTLVVVRDLFLGRTHFKEFAAAPERIATNILTNRLDRLLDHELIEQFPSKVHPGRFAYRLTAKGETLRPLLDAIVDWGLKHIEGTAVRLAPKSRRGR